MKAKVAKLWGWSLLLGASYSTFTTLWYVSTVLRLINVGHNFVALLLHISQPIEAKVAKLWCFRGHPILLLRSYGMYAPSLGQLERVIIFHFAFACKPTNWRQSGKLWGSSFLLSGFLCYFQDLMVCLLHAWAIATCHNFVACSCTKVN